ncbi:MAG: DNA translocase FtsK [Candidatus Nealsonbacteria bacterium]|nr:DNA translocase FtsK [Candidatus Nealsonbacteria bacterium]
MAKDKKNNRKFQKEFKEKPVGFSILSSKIKQKILAVLVVLVAIIVGLSFFGLAGVAGDAFFKVSNLLMGKAIFAFPLFLVLVGLVLWEGFKTFENKKWLIFFAILFFMVGLSGILGSFKQSSKLGGWVGYAASWPFLKFFEFWVSLIVFGTLTLISGLVILYPFYKQKKEREKISQKESKVSFIKREIFHNFKVKELLPSRNVLFVSKSEKVEETQAIPGLKLKQLSLAKNNKNYEKPSLDLLEVERKEAISGDTNTNAAIIKRTLQNFNIPVEMGQINIGPTVTQYTLKPAEGIKVSKITTLSNDLSLALASHPIRIEAPIPGKPLVGIEVPNAVRGEVRLRSLLETPVFQNSASWLVFALGKDVSGNPAYADLCRMPHMLVAGSTGSGKTVFLNNLILSLIYRNSPETLRLILIDPKRVEFPVYGELPHLLSPVICDKSRAVNALRWLVEEMERRFDVLSRFRSKDIVSYNEHVANGSAEPLPYIVLIIDELADLMASKGRDVEALIVRIAQMARAVGIHLVLATQRPSVEVITGLIKANITSRVAFQVASQVDSRTVFDISGAEKLLGRGDMLFVSTEISKPKRIQAALVTEKETKRVVKFIASKIDPAEIYNADMADSLKEKLSEEETKEGFDIFSRGEDPLYDTAKSVVIESMKASASLLQRRLQIGYARAARLMDMLEERGVVGPSDGAKPREIIGDELETFGTKKEDEDIIEEPEEPKENGTENEEETDSEEETFEKEEVSEEKEEEQQENGEKGNKDNENEEETSEKEEV